MPKQVGSVQCMSAITFGMLLVTFAEILAPPPGGVLEQPGRPSSQSRTQTNQALELVLNCFVFKLLEWFYEDDSWLEHETVCV